MWSLSEVSRHGIALLPAHGHFMYSSARSSNRLIVRPPGRRKVYTRVAECVEIQSSRGACPDSLTRSSSHTAFTQICSLTLKVQPYSPEAPVAYTGSDDLLLVSD